MGPAAVRGGGDEDSHTQEKMMPSCGDRQCGKGRVHGSVRMRARKHPIVLRACEFPCQQDHGFECEMLHEIGGESFFLFLCPEARVDLVFGQEVFASGSAPSSTALL